MYKTKIVSWNFFAIHPSLKLTRLSKKKKKINIVTLAE